MVRDGQSNSAVLCIERRWQVASIAGFELEAVHGLTVSELVSAQIRAIGVDLPNPRNPLEATRRQ